jgi:16S rRNA (uracil1498-N3)-methyltransferase
MRAGDPLVVFAHGQEADAKILRVEGDAVVLEVGAPRAGTVPARQITLIQGLAKGEKVDAVVRDATELGATRVIVAETERSVVRLDPARAKEKLERWSRVASEAARQSGRAAPPAIALATWKEAMTSESAARFCLYERATEPLGDLLQPALAASADLAFAVGPEGGLDDGEVALARAAGWSIVSVGPLTLRTETVAAAVLGACLVFR